MRVDCDGDHVRSGIVDENGTLVIGAEFEKLLAKVVAEIVHHEIHDVALNFTKDDADILLVALLELLLQMTAAMLILGHLQNLAFHGIERSVLPSGRICGLVNTRLPKWSPRV